MRFVGRYQPAAADHDGSNFALTHQFVKLRAADADALAERCNAIGEGRRTTTTVHILGGLARPVEPDRERNRTDANASSYWADRNYEATRLQISW